MKCYEDKKGKETFQPPEKNTVNLTHNIYQGNLRKDVNLLPLLFSKRDLLCIQ